MFSLPSHRRSNIQSHSLSERENTQNQTATCQSAVYRLSCALQKPSSIPSPDLNYPSLVNIQNLPTELIRSIGHYTGEDITNLSKTNKKMNQQVREAMIVPTFLPTPSCPTLFVSPNGDMYSTKKLTQKIHSSADPKIIFTETLQEILPKNKQLQVLMAQKIGIDRSIQFLLLGCNNANAMLHLARNPSTLPFILTNIFRLVIGPHAHDVRCAIIVHEKTNSQLIRSLKPIQLRELLHDERTPQEVIHKVRHLILQ